MLPFVQVPSIQDTAFHIIYFMIYFVPFTALFLLISIFIKGKVNVVLYVISYISLTFYLFCSVTCLVMFANCIRWFEHLPAGAYVALGLVFVSHALMSIFGILFLREMNPEFAEFKKIQSEGTPIMINMGNYYAVPYASMVTNMDLRGSEYTILDQCVPFYQLAVHGRVNYTGESINIGGNQENELLYSAEYGAGLHFTFMKESSFATQKTLYTEYYGANYDSWKDKAIEMYTRYNSELGHTFNQEMVDHENITEDLSRTEYADGTNVYVNYGYSDAQTPDGQTVPARDYLVIR